MRSIDLCWDMDSHIYFDCSHGEFIRECDCYNLGHHYKVFYPEGRGLLEYKFGEDGLVIVHLKKTKKISQQGVIKEYNGCVANFWYKNGLLHNDDGPAIICRWEADKTGYMKTIEEEKNWSFRWYRKGNPWKIAREYDKEQYKFTCTINSHSIEPWVLLFGKKCGFKELIKDFHEQIPLN